jgi:hypothetical protein
MIRRPSRHQNGILKRTAFRAGPALCSAAMITLKWSRAALNRTDHRRNTTPRPILAGSSGQSPTAKIASTGTPPVMLSP